MEIPAVSVIIPMYNAEKYIDDCLNSILGQTLQNYEVIVVDDCSTDNSYAVAKSYVDKFGGRLTLTTLKKNSGNAGYSARNKGFTFSRGEYVFFVDADDFITKTALEELYTAAKNTNADVVYTSARYRYSGSNDLKLEYDNFRWSLIKKGLEDKPTLTNDPKSNLIEVAVKSGLFRPPWTKFVRKNFLSENSITFPEILSGGDYLWTIEISAYAERFLRIPDAVYFWRDDSSESMTRKKRPVEKQVYTWSKAFVAYARAATDLNNKHEILKENPFYCYMALNYLFNFFLERNLEARLQVKSNTVYEILRREFEKEDDFNLITPFFFSIVDSQQKNLLKARQDFNKLNKVIRPPNFST